MRKQLGAEECEVSQNEYEEYLASLVELGRCEDAERLWQEHADRMRSEAAYRSMLKMFYRMENRQKFKALLEDLCQNKQVRLSPKGLEQKGAEAA